MHFLNNSITNFYISEIIIFFCGFIIRNCDNYIICTLLVCIALFSFIQFMYCRYRHYKRALMSKIRFLFIIEGFTLSIGNAYYLFMNIYVFKNSTEIDFLFILALSILLSPSLVINERIKNWDKIE